MPGGTCPPDPYTDPLAYREWYREHLEAFDKPAELTAAIDAEAARVVRLKAERGLS